MKIKPELLSAADMDTLLKALDSKGYQLIQRVVAGKRDTALVDAAQLQVKADQFPSRGNEAKAKFDDAARYNHFLEVVAELATFADKTPRAFTVVQISPTTTGEVEFK